MAAAQVDLARKHLDREGPCSRGRDPRGLGALLAPRPHRWAARFTTPAARRRTRHSTSGDSALLCAWRRSRFQLPYLDFRGTPIGLHVRKVVELEPPPAINTGILHVSEGLGQIGAGVARALLECFREALLALDRALD